MSDLKLSFTNDQTSIILTGNGNATYNSTDSVADYIALRLSTGDLSIQFDAHSILDKQNISVVIPCGQALTFRLPLETNKAIIFLTNNKYERTGDVQPIIVRDDWYYYKNSSESLVGAARHVISGQEISLEGDWENEVRGWPRIFSGQQTNITWQDQHDSSAIAVRTPGTASAALRWDGTNHEVPNGACTFGDVLYPFYGANASSSTSSRGFDITSISSGKTIFDAQQSTASSGEDGAITPWGLVAFDFFYSATSWLEDASPAPASTASSNPSSPTPTS